MLDRFKTGLTAWWRWSTKGPKWHRWAGFGVPLVTLLLIFGAASGDSKKDATSGDSAPIGAPTDKAASDSRPSATPKRAVSYEIIQRWSIPNGGEGKVVLISPDFLNEQDMRLLGEKFRNDTKKDRNAFLFVFDSREAAQVRDKVLSDKATKAETEAYDKHFVATYSRNINTGFHQLDIYYDGVLGDNRQTVEY